MSDAGILTLPPGVPERTLGWDVLWWTTHFIRRPDGLEAGGEWRFTGEQLRFVLWWYSIDERGRWLYVRGLLRRAKGWGKAGALDTPVPTPQGWSTLGALAPGDVVFDERGEPCRVVAVSPVWRDTDCWRVTFSDDESVVVSGDHLWTVEELAKRYRTVTIDTRTLAARCVMRGDGARNFRLPMSGSLNTPEVDLPIDPYVLGAWLGDGDSSGGGITTPDRPVIDRIAHAGFDVRPRANPLRWRVLGLTSLLRSSDLLDNKHVPAAYLRASEKQRLALVQGLMDADGHIDATGTCEFSTTRTVLRDAMVELLATLGVKSYTIETDAHIGDVYYGPAWRVKFTVHDDMPVFHLDRKAARLKPATSRRALHRTRRVVSVESVSSVPTRCIEVDSPSHLFLFGRRMVPTHNSPLVAALGLAELCGPVRFESFAEGGEERPWRAEPYAVGEPIARECPAAWVQLAGVSEKQTTNTMSMVLGMCIESPIVEAYGLDLGISRIYTAAGGRLEPITASAATAEGGRPTAVFEDETQWYFASNGGVELDRVNKRNAGKSTGGTSRVLETTNAHAVGELSVAERTHNAWREHVEGRSRGAQRLLYDSREAPADVDMANEDELMAALRAAYGDSTWVDLERIRDEIWDPSTPPSESRRYYLNQISASIDAWLTEPEWVACVDSHKVVAVGDTITLGFDGSRSRAKGVTDATALVGCRVSDGHLFELEVWEEPHGAAGKDWVVPVASVEAAVHDAFSRYNVVGAFCDPAKWESIIYAWEARYNRQLKVRATREHPMTWWITGGRSTLVVRALDQFHSAVVDREMTHDGSHRLTSHILNARRNPTRSGMQISKENPDSSRKIDAAVAAVLAWQARLMALTVLPQRFAPRRVR